MRLNALIGASASGKSALALNLARKWGLEIFSIDSLSVYKYVDIASAKPTKKELSEILHYGIDVLEPPEKCNAMVFYRLLESCAHEKMIIVGGSGFYLKSIIDGLSHIPQAPPHISAHVAHLCQSKTEAYKLLQETDSPYAQKINPNDTYRIQKALEIFFTTNTKPSEFFGQNTREKLPFDIRIYEICKPKEILRDNIARRVDSMFERGLVDEVRHIATHYPHTQILKAIGVKEVLWYLRGDIALEGARELIISNTNKLAKRQRTFNKTQFSNVERDNVEEKLNEYYEALNRKL